MNTDVIHAEWIGKKTRIIKATNKNLEKIEGVIVDETKNTITIETEHGIKNVQKHETVFEIEGQEVIGDKVLTSPENRIKLKVK